MRDALSELLNRVTERCHGSIEGNSELAMAAQRARALLASTTREFFVVVSQHDATEKVRREWSYQHTGPIVFECYLDKATRETAQAFRNRIGNGYGWTRVGRLIVEDWPEEKSPIASTDFWEVGETP